MEFWEGPISEEFTTVCGALTRVYLVRPLGAMGKPFPISTDIVVGPEYFNSSAEEAIDRPDPEHVDELTVSDSMDPDAGGMGSGVEGWTATPKYLVTVLSPCRIFNCWVYPKCVCPTALLVVTIVWIRRVSVQLTFAPTGWNSLAGTIFCEQIRAHNWSFERGI